MIWYLIPTVSEILFRNATQWITYIPLHTYALDHALYVTKLNLSMRHAIAKEVFESACLQSINQGAIFQDNEYLYILIDES